MGNRLLDEDFLTGTENQLRLSIDRLFNPPKNRLLTNEQWWAKAKMIDAQITTAIKNGTLPEEFRLSNCVRNEHEFWSKGIYSMIDVIKQFQKVTDYLEKRENMPDDMRTKEYGETMAL